MEDISLFGIPLPLPSSAMDSQQPGYFYRILGRPISWERPAQAKYRRYDAQKNEKFVIGTQLKQQHQEHGLDVITGPIAINIAFYFPIVGSGSLITRQRKLNSKYSIKPDIDNLTKFYLDTANGLLFKDDAQIVFLICRKYYSDNPRTDILLMPL